MHWVFSHENSLCILNSSKLPNHAASVRNHSILTPCHPVRPLHVDAVHGVRAVALHRSQPGQVVVCACDLALAWVECLPAGRPSMDDDVVSMVTMNRVSSLKQSGEALRRTSCMGQEQQQPNSSFESQEQLTMSKHKYTARTTCRCRTCSGLLHCWSCCIWREQSHLLHIDATNSCYRHPPNTPTLG